MCAWSDTSVCANPSYTTQPECSTAMETWTTGCYNPADDVTGSCGIDGVDKIFSCSQEITDEEASCKTGCKADAEICVPDDMSACDYWTCTEALYPFYFSPTKCMDVANKTDCVKTEVDLELQGIIKGEKDLQCGAGFLQPSIFMVALSCMALFGLR